MKAANVSDVSLTVKVELLVKNEHDWSQAAIKFCALGDEAGPILCSIVAAEAVRRRRIRTLFLGLALTGIVARGVLVWTVPREIREPYQILAIGMGGVGTIGLSAMFFYGGRATKLLAALDDVRLVGPMLDAVMAHSRDNNLKDTIRESLLRLLPRLQASDMARLLPRHITTLNQEIDFCRAWKWGSADEVAYAMVVFQALEQVGDETSVPVVEQVMQTTQNAKVRQAAEDCLSFLRQRATMGKNTLLRAASPAVSDLLLPARGEATADPTVLLRPLSSGENR